MVDNVDPNALFEVRETGVYRDWLDALRDERAKNKIVVRALRLGHGNPGDVRPVGGGVSELRIDYGPGYRVYYARKGEVLLLLLCGGDKSTQVRDIARAIELSETWTELP